MPTLVPLRGLIPISQQAPLQGIQFLLKQKVKMFSVIQGLVYPESVDQQSVIGVINLRSFQTFPKCYSLHGQYKIKIKIGVNTVLTFEI